MSLFSVKFQEMLLETPGVFAELDAFYKKLSAFLLTAHNDDGSLITEPAAQISELGLAVGSIVSYAGTSVPTGWLRCDGSAVSRVTYRALFTAIGTTYGSGDGATTFTLPDLRGRFPLGQAAAGTGSTLGATGGTLDHTHTGPSHTHPITADAGLLTGAPSATTVVQSGAGATVASGTHTHTTATHSHGGATDTAGAGNTGTANPPFLAVSYIILYA